VDAKILAAGIKWIDQVSRHPLVKKSLGERVLPLPDNTLETEEQRVEYVKNHISTQYHLIGTAAMGEVVDARLRVMDGTGKVVKGLRVVDASVFPGQVSGNIMSSTYADAEKGADLIKGDDGRFGGGAAADDGAVVSSRLETCKVSLTGIHHLHVRGSLTSTFRCDPSCGEAVTSNMLRAGRARARAGERLRTSHDQPAGVD
jgi:hypothetical protein